MKKYTFILKSIASLLAFVFGFSSVIVAQYGAIETNYKINGRISDFDTNIPIKGIKIALGTKDDQKSITNTDTNGHFDFYVNRWNLQNTYFFTAKDNTGEYFNKDTSLLLNYQDFIQAVSKGHWEIDRICRFEVNLKLNKEEQIADTTEPSPVPPKEDDSLLVKPILLPKDTLLLTTAGIGSSNSDEGWNVDKIFPNPTNGEVEIVIDSKNDESLIIQLFDDGYKLLSENTEHLQTGINKLTLDLKLYPAGNYFVILIKNDNRIVKKIIKL